MKGSVPGAHRATGHKRAPKGRKRVARMSISKAKGGYVVDHNYEDNGGPWAPGTQHIVSGDHKMLAKHVAKHFADEPEAEDNPQEEAEE